LSANIDIFYFKFRRAAARRPTLFSPDETRSMKTRPLSLLLLLFALPVLGQSLHVPLDYWGYGFLERMEAKGLFRSLALLDRPLNRSQVAGILTEIATRAAQDPGRLSGTDLRLLDQLKGDFADELAATTPTLVPPRQELHTARWQEGPNQAYIDLYGRISVISNRGDSYQPADLLSENTLGGILRGRLGGTLGFYADARNTLTRGEKNAGDKDENFDVSKGSPVTISGPNVFRDRALAYFVWEKPWLRIQAGRDEIDWGPGFHSGLALTRNMPPADMIRLSSHFRRFAFSSAHLFLRSPLGAKYLAAHRIDLLLLPQLQFGAGETVVYGGRDIEMDYLNPLMLYHIAEHHLGDRDNNTLFFNLSCTLLPGARLYAEYFIDDMTSTESLTRYFGNKFAFLTGALWSDPLGVKNLDLRLEYSRVEPFVYAHHDSINIYTNYDKVIGHWLGPNSDSAYLLAGYQLGRDLRLEASFERIRKGEGAPDTQARPAHGTVKHFLGGLVEKKYLTGVRIQDQVRRDLFVSLAYTYADLRNAGLVSGRSAADHLARFELAYNY